MRVDTQEPSALTAIKNNSNSVCKDCSSKEHNCNFKNKIIHKIKKDCFVKSCSSKEVE
jgi:ribosomal protein S8